MSTSLNSSSNIPSHPPLILEGLPPDALLRHRYGGFYRFKSIAKDTSNGQLVVVYAHVWPFEEQWLTRPLTEFCDGRFQLSTQSALLDFQSLGPLEAQSLISSHKKQSTSCFKINP